MRKSPELEEDGVEPCPVFLDRHSRARLARLARAAGKEPLSLAAELLREMLEDDERANAPAENLNPTTH